MRSRKFVLIGGIIAMLTMLLQLAYVPGLLPIAVSCFFFGVFSGVAMIPYTIFQAVNPDKVKGSVTGAMNFMTFGISAAIGPLFGMLGRKDFLGLFNPTEHFRATVLFWIVGFAVALVVALALREAGGASASNKACLISLAIFLSGASTRCLGQQKSLPVVAKEEDQYLSGKADSASDRKPFIGSIYPEDLSPLLPDSEATRWLHARRVCSYGWVDAGYTYNSAGSGLDSVAPSPNRFGNEFPVNGAWLVVERPTAKEGWSWGFRADFYGGSDAALLIPVPSFGPQGTHFGTDFRQAYLSLHTPGLNSRGIDFTVGRQNVPIGYETLMGPYRPMYSETYFWIHYEVGSTSALATLHPTSKLDVIGGVVMGYNTVFQLRGRAPSYILRALYRPRGSPRTQLIATVFSGPEPASVTPGHLGTWQTVAELQARHTWTDRIMQVVQAHYAADVRDPTTKLNSATQGAFLITAFKLNPKLYINTRGEWFADPHGVRTGKPGTFSEATLGLNFLPVSFLNFRPEIRGDFAGQKSYSASLGGPASRNQLTIAFDLIVKFDAFK